MHAREEPLHEEDELVLAFDDESMARAGHDVHLYEREPKAGGLLRYGIPDFKMEKEHIDFRVTQMEAEGVTFHYGANIGVTLGLGILPTWQGTFSLSGGNGASLNFTVPGSIQSDGGLSGNPSSYSLNAFGSSYDGSSLTRQDVSGKLVGPGSGAAPISGAIVEFHFEHGGAGPKISGAGGADLH